MSDQPGNRYAVYPKAKPYTDNSANAENANPKTTYPDDVQSFGGELGGGLDWVSHPAQPEQFTADSREMQSRPVSSLDYGPQGNPIKKAKTQPPTPGNTGHSGIQKSSYSEGTIEKWLP